MIAFAFELLFVCTFCIVCKITKLRILIDLICNWFNCPLNPLSTIQRRSCSDIVILKLHFTAIFFPKPPQMQKYAREVLQMHTKSIIHIYLGPLVPIGCEICKGSLAIAHKINKSYLFVSPCPNQLWNIQGKSRKCTQNRQIIFICVSLPQSFAKYAREVSQMHTKSISHIYLSLLAPIIYEICKGKSCNCTQNL